MRTSKSAEHKEIKIDSFSLDFFNTFENLNKKQDLLSFLSTEKIFKNTEEDLKLPPLQTQGFFKYLIFIFIHVII